MREKLVKHFILTYTGKEVDVTSEEGRCVIVKEGYFHIYLDPFLFIGTLEEEDVTFICKLVTLERNIIDIWNKESI